MNPQNSHPSASPNPRNSALSSQSPNAFLPGETLLEALRWRYATKKFDPARKISAADWKILEEALILSPSAFGLQPWKFLVITDAAQKEALVPLSWGQRQVADCSHLVIFTCKKEIGEPFIDDNLRRIAAVRGVSLESLNGYRERIVGRLIDGPECQEIEAWSRRQTFVALGNFLTCAALLGLDACPMEGIEPERYDRHLGLDQLGLTTAAACPVGYRLNEDHHAALAKVRFEAKDVIEYR